MAQTKGSNCGYSMRIRTSCSQWPQAKGSNCGLASPPETSAQPLLSTESSGPALWGNLALVTLSSQLHQASVTLTDEHEHLKPTIHPSDFPSPSPHTLRTPRQSFPSAVSMLEGFTSSSWPAHLPSRLFRQHLYQHVSVEREGL